MIVAFDFDDTLVKYKYGGLEWDIDYALFRMIRHLCARGDKAIIVTARCPLTSKHTYRHCGCRNHNKVEQFALKNIHPKVFPMVEDVISYHAPFIYPSTDIYYTDSDLKGELLSKLKVDVLVDDNELQRDDAESLDIIAFHPNEKHDITKCLNLKNFSNKK
jgi:hydroxymethylpyrimidine pyrophosphatase-like HAD family hydrolase